MDFLFEALIVRESVRISLHLICIPMPFDIPNLFAPFLPLYVVVVSWIFSIYCLNFYNSIKISFCSILYLSCLICYEIKLTLGISVSCHFYCIKVCWCLIFGFFFNRILICSLKLPNLK